MIIKTIILLLAVVLVGCAGPEILPYRPIDTVYEGYGYYIGASKLTGDLSRSGSLTPAQTTKNRAILQADQAKLIRARRTIESGLALNDAQLEETRRARDELRSLMIELDSLQRRYMKELKR